MIIYFTQCEIFQNTVLIWNYLSIISTRNSVKVLMSYFCIFLKNQIS